MKQIKENEIPANSMGDGSAIKGFDPILFNKIRIRRIINSWKNIKKK